MASGITAALDRTLTNPATRTAGLGGPLGTRAFTTAFISALDKVYAPGRPWRCSACTNSVPSGVTYNPTGT